MASLIVELKNVLSAQVVVYQELLDTSTTKKDIIVKNDIEALREILIVENQIIGRNQKLEKKRIEVFKDMAMVLGKPKNATLSQILESIQDQPETKEITECREKIIDLAQRLKAINDHNQELIQLSADYAEFTINSMQFENQPPQTFYDASGNAIGAHGHKMFDATQ